MKSTQSRLLPPLIVMCLLAISSIGLAQTSPKEVATSADFYAPFDGSTVATNNAEREVKPSLEQALTFVPGIKGQAVFVGGNGETDWAEAPALEYPSDSLFESAAGTVMFWVQPDWNGTTSPLNNLYRFFYAGERCNMFMYAWLRADLGVVPQPGMENDIANLVSPVRGSWRKGDWWHLALSWDSTGWSKLYVNGMPFTTGFGYRSGPQLMRQALDLGNIDKFAVGSSFQNSPFSNMRGNAAFDEFKVYRRALSDDEIVADYRRFMPVDIVFERRFLRAGESEQLSLDIWPGGQMIRPPVGQQVPTPVTLGLDLIVRQQDTDLEITEHFDLTIEQLKTLTLPLPSLEEGRYELTCKISYGGGTYQTNYPFFAFTQLAAAPPSQEPLQLGEPILTIDCTKETAIASGETTVQTPDGVDAYRESSPDRDSRFSYVLDLKDSGPWKGQPMMLEVYWPDDKPRTMGLYLYSKTSDKQDDRDRLAGGVQSGNEYALSGKTQVTRYLFYPWMKNYLFEARTIVRDMPAAVSKIVVRPVIGRLPNLAINKPKDLPGRYFGNLDEDQSFDVLMTLDMKGIQERRRVHLMEMLLDYMDYTGQNIFSYAFVRYGDVNYEMPGLMTGGDYFYQIAGWRMLLLDMLERRGKKFNMIINQHSMDELNKVPDRHDELLSSNYFQIDRQGETVKKFGDRLAGNPLHPQFRKELLGHMDELLRRFGNHPALLGIDLWTSSVGVGVDWLMTDLKTGYDDLTMSLFEKDTGIQVPNEGDDRFGKRFALLTGTHRTEWLAWRAKKNTAILDELAERVRATNPSLTLNVVVCGDPMEGSTDDLTSDALDFSQYYFESYGLDLPALRKMAGVVVTPMRFSTGYRWWLHRNNQISTVDELRADMTRQSIFRYPSGSHVYSYPAYFESYTNSLLPEDYNCMFQSADIKPHGRFFLEELSQDVGSVDPAVILIGSQPLGTSGRDDESREFSRAFLALPQGDFQDMDGLADPVIGRYLETPEGTFLYLQNMIAADVEVDLAPPQGAAITNLSNGQEVKPGAAVWTIFLKPYELQSFKLSKSTPLALKAIRLPEGFAKPYTETAAKAEANLALIAKAGGDTSTYREKIDALNLAIKENRMAEAHRLAFSKIFQQMPLQAEEARTGWLKLQNKMIAEGKYAINCGSQAYYFMDESRKLFFPDQKYLPGGHGFVGSHKSGAHDISVLDRSSFDPFLMASEAYDVEGYAFTVPNGTYTVKMHNWIGFEPDAAPGKVIMSMDIQGQRAWDKMDLFEAQGRDRSKALVSEFKDVAVTDGVLRIDWKPVNNRLGWCNAIEIYPQTLESP